MELEQVLYPKRLEEQYDGGKVGALYLGHSGRQQLFFVLTVCVQAERATGAGTACTTGPLVSISLKNEEREWYDYVFMYIL